MIDYIKWKFEFCHKQKFHLEELRFNNLTTENRN